jgi:thiol-disulfide isomerase/thioredoxin
MQYSRLFNSLKLMTFIFLACSFFLGGCTPGSSVLHDSEGHEIKLSELKGKWIIINYWADWCDSCMAEIPQLNNFYVHNQDKSVVLLGVNYDHLPADQLKQSVKKRQILYPVLLEDPSSIWGLGAMEAIPVTFIIDPKGVVKKMIVGATTENSLLGILRDLQK